LADHHVDVIGARRHRHHRRTSIRSRERLETGACIEPTSMTTSVPSSAGMFDTVWSSVRLSASFQASDGACRAPDPVREQPHGHLVRAGDLRTRCRGRRFRAVPA
jgi:hypothetical protein